MNILIYSQFCTPEPVFKSVPFAKELAARGHTVRVLTGFPNYPGGSVYSGYRLRWRQEEEIEGIPIRRVPLYPSHDASSLGRLINYGTFALSSIYPLLFGWKPDIIYVYNLVTIGSVAALVRIFREVPYVIDIQDLWPDSVFSAGMGRRWMSWPMSILCNIAYRGASLIVTQSDGFRRRLIERGVIPNKIEVVPNWCDESAFAPDSGPDAPLFPLEDSQSFDILFAGNLGRVQGLDAVIDAAALVWKRDRRIRFIFLGGGVMKEELEGHARRIAPKNTLFLPAVSAKNAVKLQRKVDVLLLHLQDNPLFEITIPSKTQAYLAVGKPILAGIRGDAADLIRRANAGLVVNPGSSSEIAAAAIRLSQMSVEELSRMGENGAEFYDRELSMRIGVSRFERIFKRCIMGECRRP